MERYKCITGDDSLEEDDDGPYALYADAQATVEALQAQVKQLEHGLTTQADAADMWYDEFLRIRALNASPEINGICDRALDGIPRTVPVVQENHQLRQQVEALQAQLESANTLLHKKNCAIGKAEMAIEALQREHSQLQALVRAVSDTMEPFRKSLAKLDEVDTLATRRMAEADAYYCAQRVLTTLDATTPAPMGSNIREEDIGKSMMRRKGGDGE